MAAGAKLNPRVKTLAQALDSVSKTAVAAGAIAMDAVYRKQEIEIFASEGASGGEKWQPLSERYRRWKEKKAPGRKILVLRGAMRRAFTVQSDIGHIVESFRIGDRWTIRVGVFGPVWWKYHEQGGRIEGRPPKRDQQIRTEKQLQELSLAVRRGIQPFFNQVLRGILTLSSFRRGL